MRLFVNLSLKYCSYYCHLMRFQRCIYFLILILLHPIAKYFNLESSHFIMKGNEEKLFNWKKLIFRKLL